MGESVGVEETLLVLGKSFRTAPMGTIPEGLPERGEVLILGETFGEDRVETLGEVQADETGVVDSGTGEVVEAGSWS